MDNESRNQRSAIYAELHQELLRQDAKWGQQNHPSVPGWSELVNSSTVTHFFQHVKCERSAKIQCDEAFGKGLGTWAHIEVEELAEVIDAKDDAARRQELIQLAAVCIQHVACIDRRIERNLRALIGALADGAAQPAFIDTPNDGEATAD